MKVDIDTLNDRLLVVEKELEAAKDELEVLATNDDIYSDTETAKRCDYLLTRIDQLTGELESIIDAIN